MAVENINFKNMVFGDQKDYDNELFLIIFNVPSGNWVKILDKDNY
jgi:hypothetical protein